MLPKIRKKWLFLLLVTTVFIMTWATVFHGSTKPHLFVEMKTSLNASIKTWNNLAYILDTQSVMIINASKWLENPEEWEASLLNDTLFDYQVPDILTVSSAHTSALVLLNHTDNFKQRQTVAVRIDVGNGYGLPQSKGGDDVRVWLTDTTECKSLVGSVTDLNNGSYFARIEALFTGKAEIKAAIIHPRELNSLTVAAMRQGAVQFFAGLFERGSYSEVTLCDVFPSLPNYTSVCDFTSENNNFPWFCGQPHSSFLSCQDWVSVRTLPAQELSTLSSQGSRSFMRHLALQGKTVIPSTVKIRVQTDDHDNVELPPCTPRSRPYAQLWLEHSPRGWIREDKWHPRSCHTLETPEDILQDCLNSTTIILLGKSLQTERMLKGFQKLTACKTETAFSQTCTQKKWAFKVLSQPLALPLNSGNDDEWVPKSMLSNGIDSVPDSGKFAVVIDHSVTGTTMHPSVYRARVRKTVLDLGKLMDRNHKVFAAVIGPEASSHQGGKDNRFSFAHSDLFTLKYFEILEEEYRILRKRVMFLDGWDMSLSLSQACWQSAALPSIWLENTKMLLNYACDFYR